MLTISSGHSADYLTSAVATGRENYYTGAVAAGEPPGRWYGRGAEALGLRGLVDTQDMTALYEHFIDPRDEAFKDPARWGEASTLGHTGRKYLTEDQLYAAALDTEPNASPERRAELRLEASKKARRNVAFLDATYSVQKSITVLHAAFEAQEVAASKNGDTETAASWAAHRKAVEDAIWAGNQAGLEYLAEHAGYSRVGHHGGAAGRFIDAHDWTVASFFQHDSRDHDPQLHIHNAILNRVQGSDGVWRTLDGRALYAHRGAASAVAERTTEEHLARSLGVRFATRPDGKAREVVGVPAEVMDLFSSRRRAITRKTAQLVTAFESKFNRKPNSLELDRLQRQATFATRNAKSHSGETVEQRLERWDRELRAEVAGGLATVARDVLDLAGESSAPARWSRTDVIETALTAVQTTKAAWTAADLTRAVSDALPDHLGLIDPGQVARLLDGLTAEALALAVPLDAERPGTEALPAELRLANGRSVYAAPGRRRYATPQHLHTERLLTAATTRRDAPALAPTAAAGFVSTLAESGIELGADQAAAVRGVLTSAAEVESLVGPAGTGKSFVVGVIAKAWQDPELWAGEQRRVVGLAASQIATDVLAGEGLAARNITRWLATQQRLAAGRLAEGDAEWQLRRGDLVVVDESAMAGTADLAAIHRHVSDARAKLLLTGDHHQLAAVGAGGAMDLVATAGRAYELAEARRFDQDWERDASLRLRAGDETVLGDYHKHGRIRAGGTVEETERHAMTAWLTDNLNGRRSLLVVDTNEQAARLSASIRASLVAYGHVEETGVPLGLQGTVAGVGDLVQARRNGWDLTGYDGNRRGPINRETYRVLDTRDDGGLVVAPVIGATELGDRLTLPGTYVAEHVALGYASTVHAAQGLTVDTSHTVVTTATGADALYVGMGRGRHGNTAHVTTRAVAADAPTGTAQDALTVSPMGVLANIFERTDRVRSALATATESTDETAAVRTPAELLADAAELATAGRTARWLDQLVHDGHLTAEQRLALAAEDGSTTLTRLLRRAELAGHDPQQVLVDAVTSRPLDDARQLTNVLHHRISTAVTLDPVGDTYAEWVPQVDDPQWRQYLQSLAVTADARRAELALTTTTAPPAWAIEAFGPVPEDEVGRTAWEARAGLVAAHRELTRHDDPEVALGPAPKAGQVEAYASWRAAWRALGRPEADRDELEMSDGQLRMRVRACQREQAWAPPFVASQLAGTIQAAATHRQTATLRQAEATATATADTAVRARLEKEAADAAALADVLDAQVRQLEQADLARGHWLAHTAATRVAAERAEAELSARRALDGRDDELITAAEWLDAHEAAMRAENNHRTITDPADLHDVAQERTADLEAVEIHPDAAETALPDVRETATAEPAALEDDAVRVPTAAETADTIRRAQRALAEIEQRSTLDDRYAADEARAQQLTRWHVDDQTAADDAARAAERDEPALEASPR